MFPRFLIVPAVLLAGLFGTAAAVAVPPSTTPVIQAGDDPGAAEAAAAAAAEDPEAGTDPGLFGYTLEEIQADPTVLADVCSQVVEDLSGLGIQPLDLAGEDEDADLRVAAPFDLEAACAAVERAAAAAAAATTPTAATATQTVRSVLASGRIATGRVTVSGPSVVRQELWLPATATGTAMSRAKRARGKKAGKVVRTGKAVLVGKLTRVAKRRGDVEMVLRLTPAGRKALRAATTDLRFTVQTTTRLRTGKGATKASRSSLTVTVKLA